MEYQNNNNNYPDDLDDLSEGEYDENFDEDDYDENDDDQIGGDYHREIIDSYINRAQSASGSDEKVAIIFEILEYLGSNREWLQNNTQYAQLIMVQIIQISQTTGIDLTGSIQEIFGQQAYQQPVQPVQQAYQPFVYQQTIQPVQPVNQYPVQPVQQAIPFPVELQPDVYQQPAVALEEEPPVQNVPLETQPTSFGIQQNAFQFNSGPRNYPSRSARRFKRV